MSRDRDELWVLTYEAYKKAKDEYDRTDPSDEHYNDVCNNLNDVMKQVLEMAQEDKKLKWDKIKFGIGTGFGVLQTAATLVFGVVMMDWEQSNSMRSRFFPTVQQMLPKSWRMPTNNI